MRAPVTSSRPTTRAHTVNFGDKTLVRAAEPRKPLCEISVNEPQAFTAYVTARIEPATASALPMVFVEWGHGGAAIQMRELVVDRLLRLPLAGSMVRLAGRIVDADGNPLPRTSPVKCHFTAFVAPAVDGQTLRNTRWTSQRGAEGLVSDGPELVMTIEGYPSTVASRWLMVFDAATRPPNGTFPRIAVPARRAYRVPRFDGHGFRRGVYWVASSTPMTLTFDGAADLRVDVEVLT